MSCSLADPCWEGATARAISLAHAADGELDEARLWIDQALSRSQRVTDTYATVQAAILATSAELSAAAGDGVRTEHYARSLVALAARAHLDHYLPRGIALLHPGSSVTSPGSDLATPSRRSVAGSRCVGTDRTGSR